MKTIGVIGGMSWESTQIYYRLINQSVRDRMGGLHSARLILFSVDFAEIEQLQRENRWDQAADQLSDAARSLQRAGADFVIIATNTMHKVAPEVARAIDVPLLHIMEATSDALLADGVNCVGLLGTRFTMEESFCVEPLEARGLRVLVPGAEERNMIHRVIFEELCRGVLSAESRSAFREVIEGLSHQGCEAVILGCTEIGLLVTPSDTDIPLYDTTQVHVDRAVSMALSP